MTRITKVFAFSAEGAISSVVDNGDTVPPLTVLAGQSSAPPMIGGVMKTDGFSAANAYVEKNWGSDNDEIWVTFGLGFTAASLANWESNSWGAGWFTIILSSGGDEPCLLSEFPVLQWVVSSDDDEGFASSPTPVADVWQLIELHIIASSNTAVLYVDGTMAVSLSGSFINPCRRIRIGQDSALIGGANLVYIKDVKVGTARGGTELFADDFSSGNFTNWGSVVGDCSIVADPF